MHTETATNATAAIVTDGDVGHKMPSRRRRIFNRGIVVLACIAVLIAAVVGIGGLTQNPVTGTSASGVTTLQGTFEPYGCGSACVEGYVQAGARSVFVIFPTTCAAPARAALVTLHGRLDSSQGSATYRIIGCS